MVDVQSNRSRIAAVHLHQLPLECAFGFGIEAVAAVRQDIRGRDVLIDLSPDARGRGLLVGMTVTEAKAREPDLEVRDRLLEVERKRLESAAEILFSYGSIVEVAPPAFLFVEIGRSARVLEKLAGSPKSIGALEDKIAQHIARAMARAGHRVSVAIAKDPDTARTLAAQLSAEWRKKLAAPAAGGASRRSIKIKKKRAAKDTRARPAKTAPPRAEPKPIDEVKTPGLVIPTGQEIKALAHLPVEALLWTDALEDPDGLQKERMHAIHASLRVLGIYDVARLRTLPSQQVASRFGDVGAILMARAMGRRERPLRPFSLPDQIVEKLDLDGPVEDLDPILFMLKRIFDRIEARLEARGAAAGGLRLVFDVEPALDTPIADTADRKDSSRREVEIRLSFARPTRKAQLMLSLAREKLQNALPGAVRALSIEVIGTSTDRGAQLDLFSAYAKKVEEVSALVGRLQAALGDEAVFSPEVNETHRPEAAWRMRPFEIERALDALKMDVERPPRKDRANLQKAPQRGTLHPTQALPEVKSDLLVADMPRALPGQSIPTLEDKKKSWPKPYVRKLEDEPLPKLPARPLELLPSPEPATLIAASSLGGASRSSCVLVWRGERCAILSLSGCERFETEWWTDQPLAREYVIAELADGRKLWLFFEPSGEVFVHGAFD